MKIVLEPIEGIHLYSNDKPYTNEGCVLLDTEYLLLFYNKFLSSGKAECARIISLPYEDKTFEVFTKLSENTNTFIIDVNTSVFFNDFTKEQRYNFITKLKNVWIPKDWNVC